MKRLICLAIAVALALGLAGAALAYDSYQIDDFDDNIKTIQSRLVELGYLTGKADGWFGQKTKSAVSKFQLMHDLEDTGIADDGMQQLLFSDAAQKSPKVLMSLDELKVLLGEAGALGVRYDLSDMVVDRRSATCELNNYVTLSAELFGDDLTEIQLIGTQNVKIPFTMVLMALDKSIDISNMYTALDQMIEEEQRVVGKILIRYEVDDKDIQRLIVTPLEEGTAE